jgi:general secretion pathway protein K
VLWTLVLIAFLVAHLTASARSETQISENLVANAVAAAAAEGAIAQAIFKFTDPQPEMRWPLDGTWHEVAIGNSRVAVQLEDEAARVNPNRAPPALLEALFVAAGSDEATARRLTNAIGEWVGTAPDASPPALLAEYRAAGRDYGPPGTPLESLDELRGVLGMTPAIFAAIRPHLTLFGPAVPDPTYADPVVIAALARSSRGSAAPATVTTGASRMARITAAARGPGGAHAIRAAVVTTGPGLPGGYFVLAFGNRIE